MKKLFAVSALILSVAIVLNSCSGGGGSSGFLPTSGGGTGGTGTIVHSTTTTISGTVQLSSTVSTKPSSGTTYKAAATGSTMDKVLTAAGVKQAVSMPPLVNAAMKLYNADQPDWIYPVSQVFTDSLGRYKFDVLMNADLNGGGTAYVNGDPIPAGNYTVIATNDTTVSGGKQYVAVQTIVKRFEGDMIGNDLVVQDSDALPSVAFMLGLKPNSDGTFGASNVSIASNAGIQIIFSMAMARLSVMNAVKLYNKTDDLAMTTPKEGTWKFTPDLLTATFYPTGGMITGKEYSVKIAGGFTNTAAAVNVYGKQLPESVTATFTADEPDSTPPQNLMLLEPGSTNVPITTSIMIGSPEEPIDINTMTVVGTPSIGDKPAVNYVGIKKVTIPIPVPHDVDYYIYQIGHTPLELAKNYSITISGVRDMAQNQISPLTFAFKTETTTAGIDPAETQDKQDRQLAVKDVFGKWMNAMNARNAAMLTTYMTGGFYWVPNGWSPYDLNRDGRLSLNEFRNQLSQMFSDFDHCQTAIDGNAETSPYIDITGNTASIQFHLNFTHSLPSAATDPVCTALGTGTGVMKADMENINSAWLISKGADSSAATYPPVLDVVELSAPPKGITLAEPTPSSPLNPDFVWTAVSGISTYAVIITDAKSSETGWVALIDGSNVNQGDQMTFTYSSDNGCVEPADYDPAVGGTCTRFVMPSGGSFGFTKNITRLIADGKYYWSVIGFKTSTIDGTDGLIVTGSLADDLGASSQSFNFSVANDKGPYVIGKEPADDTIKTVPKDLSEVKAVFSEAMDPVTIDTTTFYITDTNNDPVSVNPSISYDADTMTATLTLGASLPNYDTVYRIHVTTGVRDSANPDGDTATHDGNRMDQEVTWEFKTEIAPDTTPPTTTASPAAGLYNTTQNVILTANEQVQFIKYCTGAACDPSAGTVYTGAIPIAATTTLRFYASDKATPANDELVKEEIYTIDSVKPNVTALPAGGYFNASQMPVSVTLSVDKTATIYYTTNGSDPTPGSSSYSSPISFTSDGTYALKFYAVDSAGNADQIHSEQYILDSAKPDSMITSNPAELTSANFANFTFMSNEATATFECDVDGAGYASCANPYTVNAAEGAHTFSVRAVDAAGNKDATPATFAWTRDITPPAGSIRIYFGATPNAAYATNTSVTLTLAAADNFSTAAEITMSFSNDNVFWTDAEPLAATKAWTLSSADGLKNVSVRFYDKLGNKSQYNDSIMLDTMPPVTTFTQTPPLVSGSQYGTFEFRANEEAQRFECSMDGAAFTTCATSPPYTYTSALLSDGSDHTFRVQAVDMAGQTGVPVSYTWSVDTTLLITMATPGTGQYNNAHAPVNVTLTATGIASSCISPAPKTYWCEGSGCNPTTDYSVSTPSFNSNGTHILRFYSQELGGGTCTAPEDESGTTGIKEQVYTLDLTAPTTTITGYPANPTNNNSASFSFNASEAATFECDLDGGGYTACASPMNYVNLNDATHTFSVRAIDTFGNTGSPATRTWKIDTTPPYGGSIVINSNATYTNSTTVTLTLSASDASSTVASVLVSNDASAWTSYPYTGTPMNLSWGMPIGEGAKYVYVKFVDSVGNVSTMYSDGIILDTIVPDTYIYGAPANPTTARGSYFYFYASETATFQCSTNGGVNWYACSNPTWVYQSFDGTYNFQVRATDSSGLTDASPSGYGWQIFTGYWDSPGLWNYSNWAN